MATLDADLARAVSQSELELFWNKYRVHLIKFKIFQILKKNGKWKQLNKDFSGFHRLNITERLQRVAEESGLSSSEQELLQNFGGLPSTTADGMVENVIGVIGVPLGIATNLLLDGRELLVPMATEESSVIAAVCNAAKQCRSGGGIVTSVSGTEMIAQLQLLELQDPEQARLIIIEHREEIRNFCDAIDPVLVEHGGGFRDIQVHVLETRGGQMLITHLIVDTRDAMVANAVNSMAEALAPELERWTGGRINLRILSNLADRRLARARGVWKLEDIGGKQVRDDILSAFWFAEADPYRAATHNKGIMNGIAAVALATGNDTRALEVCNKEKRVFSETVCLQRFLRISNN